jgi:hypothetical protein
MSDILSRLLASAEDGQQDISPADLEAQDTWAKSQQAKQGPLSLGGRAFDNILGAIMGALGGPGDEGVHSNTGYKVGAILSAALPLASPIRNPAFRSMLLKRLMQQTEQAGLPAHTVAAASDFLKRYPRLGSHLTSLSGLPEQSNLGAAFVSTEGNLQAPRGVLKLSPKLVDADAARFAIRHEGQHMADMVKLNDRARHAAAAGEAVGNTPFKDAYTLAGDKSRLQYFNNPFEVRARRTSELGAIPKAEPNRWALAQRYAEDPIRAATKAAEIRGVPLDESKLVNLLIDQQGLLNDPALRSMRTVTGGPGAGRDVILKGGTSVGRIMDEVGPAARSIKVMTPQPSPTLSIDDMQRLQNFIDSYLRQK